MFNFIKIKLLVLLFIVLIISSCSNPTSSDKHTDVEGLELLINDVVVYKEFEGQYYVNGVASDTSAVISINLGTTYDVTIHFLDHDSSEIQHDDQTGDEDELSFTITNSNIKIVEAEEHSDDGDVGHHELGFELTGSSSGITTFTIALMHGTHSDYISKQVRVIVQ